MQTLRSDIRDYIQNAPNWDFVGQDRLAERIHVRPYPIFATPQGMDDRLWGIYVYVHAIQIPIPSECFAA